jgi:hypothetical protein
VLSVQVLGMSYEDLAVGVARAWGLPDALQRCMRAPSGDAPQRPAEGAELHRWLGRAANTMTDALLEADADDTEAALRRVAERHARVLDVSVERMLGATQAARERVASIAQALNLHVAPGQSARRLLAAPEAPSAVEVDTLTVHRMRATRPADLDEATIVLSAPAPAVAEQLAAGMQDITNAMVAPQFKLNDVLRMVLETMYRALDFQRIVFCLRDAKSNTLIGRFGLGADVDSLAPQFRVALKAPAGAQIDLFSAICLKGVDTLINDTGSGNVAARLPEWYRQHVNAPAFLLLPLALKGAPFALIYADMARAEGIRVEEKELSLLRTLRNQAVMAFRQAG